MKKWFLMVFLMAVMVSGCGGGGISNLTSSSQSPKAPDPTTVRFTIIATSSINPNSRGRPSPILLDIYQLSGYQKLLDASFFDLRESQGQVIGGDLLKRETLSLNPGDSLVHQVTVESNAQYVGVTGGFIEINRASWRGVVDLEQNRMNDIVIRVDGRNLFVERPKGSQLPSYGYSDARDDLQEGVKEVEQGKSLLDGIRGLF